MSELLNKSKSNKRASDLLIQSKDFAPSVHCSYYSLLLLAQHVVLSLKGKSITELCNEHRFRGKNPSSHHVIREEMLNLVKNELKSRRDFESFNTSFNLLKKQRENADYSEIEIVEDVAINAMRNNLELSKIINKLL